MQRMMEDAPQGEPQIPENAAQTIADLDWPEEVRAAGEKAGRAMISVLQDKEAILEFLDNGTDFVNAAATLVATQAGEADKRFDLPDEILYGTGGLSELAMAIVFQVAEEAGIPEASDPEAYQAACDMADEMAGYTGEGEAEPDGDELPLEDEPAPPQFDENRAGPPRGRPVMAA